VQLAEANFKYYMNILKEKKTVTADEE